MPILRSPEDQFELIDHTDMINKIDRQHQLFDDRLFDIKSTTQTAILFDVNEKTTTLVPSIERGAKESVYGSDNVVQTRALPLAYFKFSDYITSSDLLSQRAIGTVDSQQTLELARAEKLVDMRRKMDQTHEYLKLQAIKGVFKTPEGTVYADMFDEFGVVQDEVDFELSDSTTDVLGKIRKIRRMLKDNLQNGGFINGLDIFVSPDFYDALISHETVKEAYKYYQGTTGQAGNAQPLRDNLNDTFVYGGVRFVSLDGSFSLPNGTSEDLIEAGYGHVVPNVSGLFKGFYGPSNKLSMVTKGGQPMFSWEYTDPRGESHELQAESAPLFYCQKPRALIKVKA